MSEAIRIGTVTAITTAGVKIKVDGEEASDGKEYKCNTGVVIKAGDRVLLQEDSGTYVVQCVIGAPMQVQTLSLTAKDMGVTTVTSSNYLNVLNNVVGILKKYGMIN